MIKAEERQAAALEAIRDVLYREYGGVGPTLDESGEPATLSHATDESTFAQELRDRHRSTYPIPRD